MYRKFIFSCFSIQSCRLACKRNCYEQSISVLRSAYTVPSSSKPPLNIFSLWCQWFMKFFQNLKCVIIFRSGFYWFQSVRYERSTSIDCEVQTRFAFFSISCLFSITTKFHVSFCCFCFRDHTFVTAAQPITAGHVIWIARKMDQWNHSTVSVLANRMFWRRIVYFEIVNF